MKRAGLHLAWLILFLSAAVAWPLRAAEVNPHETGFMSITLHDVVDTPAALDEDSITSDRFVVLLEWLTGYGWTAISLDDVERARKGIAPLPPRAVLITVDDGLASLYTRVYPLAMAYRMPVVAALVTQWIDVPPGGSVRYGERDLPRPAFVSWQQAREMQASGWVEFASHSDALHTVVQANPQGNLLPAGQNRRHVQGRYETGTQFRDRIRADLLRSRERMQAELGRAPRAIVWPYGRYNDDALDVAKQLGFDFAMTLEPGPADAMRPHEIARFHPTGDPPLATWVDNLRLRDPWPSARRIVAFDTAQLVGGNAAQTDARLGRAIEQLVALGATHVMLDAGVLSTDGRLQSAWFPNEQVPVRDDVMARFAAQMRARAGVDVIVRLPHEAVLRRVGSAQRALDLYRDLVVQVPFEGLVLEGVPSLGKTAAEAADAPWQVMRRRESERFADWPENDATAMHAFLVAARWRPGLQAYWLAPESETPGLSSSLAEVTLVPRTVGPKRTTSVVPAALSRRSGLFLRVPVGASQAAVEVARAARTFQIEGGTVIGWAADDASANADDEGTRVLAPVVSARRFPVSGGRGP